jgi:hypothetical protein
VQAGHLDVVLWLSKHGCAYDVTQATVQAAYFGHIDILHWLLQQAGAPMGPRLMYVAAKGGQLLVCQHLRELDCAWDSTVSAAAACNGHLSVLKYLHEHGCPWVDNTVAMLSARSGSIVTMAYVLQHAVLQHNDLSIILSDMLRTAGAHGHLAAAQWLRHEQGAQWPAVLSSYVIGETKHWSGEVLAWAQSEGCTSLIL